MWIQYQRLPCVLFQTLMAVQHFIPLDKNECNHLVFTYWFVLISQGKKCRGVLWKWKVACRVNLGEMLSHSGHHVWALCSTFSFHQVNSTKALIETLSSRFGEGDKGKWSEEYFVLSLASDDNVLLYFSISDIKRLRGSCVQSIAFTCYENRKVFTV